MPYRGHHCVLVEQPGRAPKAHSEGKRQKKHPGGGNAQEES